VGNMTLSVSLRDSTSIASLRFGRPLADFQLC